MMITWNIDPTLYTFEQLEKLYYAVDSMDLSIANEIAFYLKSNNYWK